jgi:hypothetical protein
MVMDHVHLVYLLCFQELSIPHESLHHKAGYLCVQSDSTKPISNLVDKIMVLDSSERAEGADIRC